MFFEADDVIIAIGQDNAFPWIERDIGRIREWGYARDRPCDLSEHESSVFFGGDAAFGLGNIITAVAQHGHQAAISMDRFIRGEDVHDRL